MQKNNKAASPNPAKPAAKPLHKKQGKQTKLQKLVKSNPHFGYIQNGKIKCNLTGHQFAPTLQNFEAYLTSKSYKKGLESQFDISDFQDYLVPFKGNANFLFCRLTGVKLPKKKTAIERHVKSKKFQLRLKKLMDQNKVSQEEEDSELEFVDDQASEDQEEAEGEEEQEEAQQEQVKEVKVKKNSKKEANGKNKAKSQNDANGKNGKHIKKGKQGKK